MSNFGVLCVTKNKRPQCDEDKRLVQDNTPIIFNSQAVMFKASSTVFGVDVGAANAVFEIGDESPVPDDESEMIIEEPTGDITLAATLPTSVIATGNGAIPVLPTDSANLRRLKVQQSGIYFYDMTYTYLSTPNDGTTVFRFGPTVFRDGVLTFYTDNAHSLSQRVGLIGTNGVQPNFSINVSGNLNLNINDEVGMFRHTVVPGTAVFVIPVEIRVVLTRIVNETT